jgi:hypothetical protein
LNETQSKGRELISLEFFITCRFSFKVMHQEGGERKGEGRENLDAFNDGF